MTIEELIQELEALRDEHGPHIEVVKRQPIWYSTQPRTAKIEAVKLEDEDEDPANWTISL